MNNGRFCALEQRDMIAFVREKLPISPTYGLVAAGGILVRVDMKNHT